MIEVLPNWHPMFVHFTIALFTISFLVFIFTFIATKIVTGHQRLVKEFEIVGRWCLWFAALITVGTILAGVYAFYTVKHDEVSHMAMIEHRNWALVTAFGIFILALWTLWIYLHRREFKWIFIISLIVVQGLLVTTAWKGGELVYRHGLGVISVPNLKEHHHHED